MSFPHEKDLKITPASGASEDVAVGHADQIKAGENDYEIFKRGEGQVDFRTVSWIRASAIFTKRKQHLVSTPEGIPG